MEPLDVGLTAASAGTTRALGPQIVFSNSNGVSFGVDGNTVTASHNAVTSQTVQPVAASGSNGSFVFSTLTFGVLNGVSFYFTNGSLVASHNGLTTARSSNDAVGLNTALTAGPLAWTVNSNGISLNAGSAAGTTTGFAGNLISASMTHDTAGLNLSLNHPAWLTTAMASNRGSDFVQATAAFAGTNASGTIASNGISVSVGAGGAFSAGVSTGGNTGGNTGVTGTRLVLLGSNNVTLSQTTDANGATVGFNVDAPGGANTFSYWKNFDLLIGPQTQSISGSTHHVQPFELPYAISASFLLYPVTRSVVSTERSPTSTTDASRGGSFIECETHNFVLYSRGSGASSMSLQSVTSTSQGTTRSMVYTIAANGSQMSSVYSMCFNLYGSNTTTAFSASESVNVYRYHSSVFSNFNGARLNAVNFAASLTQGIYWIDHCFSRSTASSRDMTIDSWMSILSAASMSMSRYMLTQVNSSWRYMGSTSSDTMHLIPGLGSWTTNSLGRTTESIALSIISTSSSQVMWPFQMIRIA